MPAFFTPIVNPDLQQGIYLSTLGGFAEKYLAWGDKSYRIIKGEKKNIDIVEDKEVPQLSMAWKISRFTIVIPALMLALKSIYRFSNNFKVIALPAEQKKKIEGLRDKALTKTVKTTVGKPQMNPVEIARYRLKGLELASLLLEKILTTKSDLKIPLLELIGKLDAFETELEKVKEIVEKTRLKGKDVKMIVDYSESVLEKLERAVQERSDFHLFQTMGSVDNLRERIEERLKLLQQKHPEAWVTYAHLLDKNLVPDKEQRRSNKELYAEFLNTFQDQYRVWQKCNLVYQLKAKINIDHLLAFQNIIQTPAEERFQTILHYFKNCTKAAQDLHTIYRECERSGRNPLEEQKYDKALHQLNENLSQIFKAAPELKTSIPKVISEALRLNSELLERRNSKLEFEKQFAALSTIHEKLNTIFRDDLRYSGKKHSYSDLFNADYFDEEQIKRNRKLLYEYKEAYDKLTVISEKGVLPAEKARKMRSLDRKPVEALESEIQGVLQRLEQFQQKQLIKALDKTGGTQWAEKILELEEQFIASDDRDSMNDLWTEIHRFKLAFLDLKNMEMTDILSGLRQQSVFNKITELTAELDELESIDALIKKGPNPESIDQIKEILKKDVEKLKAILPEKILNPVVEPIIGSLEEKANEILDKLIDVLESQKIENKWPAEVYKNKLKALEPELRQLQAVNENQRDNPEYEEVRMLVNGCLTEIENALKSPVQEGEKDHAEAISDLDDLIEELKA